MGLMSFIKSSVVKANKSWRQSALQELDVLKITATVSFGKDLWSICADVLNTGNVFLTSSIGFATLVYGGLSQHRDMGSGVFNAYTQLASDVDPNARLFIGEISSYIATQRCRDRVDFYLSKRVGDFRDAVRYVVAEWCLEKLTKMESPQNKELAIDYLSTLILVAAGAFKS